MASKVFYKLFFETFNANKVHQVPIYILRIQVCRALIVQMIHKTCQKMIHKLVFPSPALFISRDLLSDPLQKL